MLEFCTWPWAAREIVTLLLALCVFVQAGAIIVSVYRRPRTLLWVMESGMELAVLFQILVCSLLYGQLINGYELALVPPSGNAGIRTAVFLLVVLTAAAAVVLSRRPQALLAAALACLALPAVEQFTGRGFAYIFAVSLALYLARSAFICVSRFNELHAGVSSRSIKYAIDSLRTGILFCEPDGFVLISNIQMQRLMVSVSNGVQRNGLRFYESLVSGDILPGCTKTEFEEQIVCLLPDGGAWMFTKAELRLSNRKYIQITAADITERWELTAELNKQNEQLQKRGEELGRAIERIHVFSREKETQKAKIRAHDILGQRLTMLLRAIRNKHEVSEEMLHTLLRGLPEDLMAGEGLPAAQSELESLVQTFASIDVEIQLSGAMPKSESVGRLFVEIIRESVTNAVRHGFATGVFVQIDLRGEGYCLTVTNNGHAPYGAIVEGGGLGGMRRKLEPFGGTLLVTPRPCFALTILIPGDACDV